MTDILCVRAHLLSTYVIGELMQTSSDLDQIVSDDAVVDRRNAVP